MVELGRIETRKISERRQAPRTVADLDVRLRLPALDVAYLGRSSNISANGMYVLVDSFVPVGVNIEVELFAIGALVPMQLRARVVRHGVGDEPSGMGLLFVWISPEASAFIERVLNNTST